MTETHIQDTARAANALRCAWLREHANRFDEFDANLLACQLRDFADLLEVAERMGWFA
ncbi:hypothetical protein [Nocardia cyriacigeorgica]|uniref:hypothetical protein n=1 Tax=Nocardia cyriacigeorgica TaxID=135487 RepID=UPI0018943A50|nr:hypothetical protein [Nocardia cyriacigeorgica]MBF6285407.1 hypothetical protein [Nocardia cyriacigeorgica]